MTISQDELVRLANNPERGINRVVSEIEANWFDKRVFLNSKSHPFVLAADLILGSTHGVLNRIEDGISRIFPPHARNISELSRHMSSEERFGMFGNPSSCQVNFGIQEEIFMALAKEITVNTGKVSYTYRMLLLPKDTEVTWNGYTFAIENGVEIRYSEKTGYQVVYDDETPNPYAPVSDNLLKRDFRGVDDRWFIIVTIPVRQLACKAVENLTSNESTGCRGTIEYPDFIYGVRAFLIPSNQPNRQPREIKVTYDQDVFNPSDVTLALNIDQSNNRFDYEIPDVYIANGLGLGIVRIYVYTTKGELVKDFTQLENGSSVVNYQDYRYGVGNLGEFSAGLRNSGGIIWTAATETSGGSNPLTFEQIKRRFIEGRNQRALPITETNLSGSVEDFGYSSVKTIDYLTKRSYALTRELPIQTNKKFFSPMACFVGSYLASANDMIASGVVIDNGQRVTIPHNVLFNISTPTTVLVNEILKDRYNSMSGEQLVDLVNNNTFVYTPFYHVIDMTNTQAVLRTYHIDQPRVNYQTFKGENSALGLEVGVGSISIEHQDDGYLITIVTKSGNSYKELDNNSVGLQLSIAPTDTTSLATMAATLYGVTEDKERIFTLKLESRFDIDVNDIIYFNNFHQFGERQDQTGLPLESEYTLIFTTIGDRFDTDTETDHKINQDLFSSPMIGIIETSYNITLGKLLNNFYNRIRPLVGEQQYKRYQFDVPETYLQNEYERNEKGEYVFDDEGRRILIHKAGDIVYNTDGGVRLLNRANDVIFEDGKPVPVGVRDLKYHWDFIAFDGTYYFTRDVFDKQFASDTKNYFINVIDQNMTGFAARALDQTSLVFQPRNKLGYQKVIVNGNAERTLRQDLKFSITYYLTRSGFKNQNLKDTLTESTPKVINELLFNASTVGSSDLSTQLKNSANSEVVDVKLSAWSGDDNVDVISSVDNLTGFSIRKLLRLATDGMLTVEEDVEVIFVPHDVRMLTSR